MSSVRAGKRGHGDAVGNVHEKRVKVEGETALRVEKVKQENSSGHQGEGQTSVRRVAVWFRTDLRVEDNSALESASATGAPVFGLFVVSGAEWHRHDYGSVKVDFWLRNAAALRQRLLELNIPLVVRSAAAPSEVPQLVLDVCRQYNASDLFFNTEYEVDEARRDAAVAHLSAVQGGPAVHALPDQCVIPPGTLLTQAGRPYTVFTPYRKSWYTHLRSSPDYLRVRAAPAAQPADWAWPSDEVPSQLPAPYTPAEVPATLWPAGEQEAHRRLEEFAARRLSKYAADRNDPALAGTSALSPYLALGVISARQCVQRALRANGGKAESGQEGAVTWISELVWRDFYRNVLHAFPRVCMNQPFKLDTKRVQWRDAPEEFRRWCEGRTGYPLVDAAMQQLLRTGWMHNRLRMVTAMFLTKHLLIDWRLGERFFMNHLVDGDFASNNGGWQWSASTGTDAQPYFRIFNPVQQSLRFDPKGVFIKQQLPVLRSLSGDALHDPSSHLPRAQVEKLGYVWHVVEHAPARQRALAVFKAALGAGARDEQAEPY